MVHEPYRPLYATGESSALEMYSALVYTIHESITLAVLPINPRLGETKYKSRACQRACHVELLARRKTFCMLLRNLLIM